MLVVVIPCYRVKKHILKLLEEIGPEVSKIYVVDDACPEQSGKYVESNVRDPRVKVLYNSTNQGVGGACIAGFQAALNEGASTIVKIDGDGQMNPAKILLVANPVLKGLADYAKGNRFYSTQFLASMPAIRIFGNAMLSFITKVTTGNWHIMDPTNGFFALHAVAAKRLPWDKIERGYFFETDLLYHLHLIRAVIFDVPLAARYGDEVSNLKISRALWHFSAKHFSRFFKRLAYDYYVRDFNIASLELVFGIPIFIFSVTYGGYHYINGLITGIANERGVVTITLMSFLTGLHLILAFLNFDTSQKPQEPLQKVLS